MFKYNFLILWCSVICFFPAAGVAVTCTSNLDSGCLYALSIVLPSTISTIAQNAFSNTPYVDTIYLPNTITRIQTGAFQQSPLLTNINIPSTVTAIDDYVFYYCTALKVLDLTPCTKLLSIGMQVFTGSNLISISIPASVTSLADYSFYYTKSLISVTFLAPSSLVPSGNTKVGIQAFIGCQSLTTVTFSSAVASVGDSAFYGLTSLVSVTCANPPFSFVSSTFQGSGVSGCTSYVTTSPSLSPSPLSTSSKPVSSVKSIAPTTGTIVPTSKPLSSSVPPSLRRSVSSSSKPSVAVSSRVPSSTRTLSGIPSRKPSAPPSLLRSASSSSKPSVAVSSRVPSSTRTLSGIPSRKPSPHPSLLRSASSSSKPSVPASSFIPSSVSPTTSVRPPSSSPSSSVPVSLPVVPSAAPSSSKLKMTNCSDYYPFSDGFTCAQQAAWGKCTLSFMQPPNCAFSCNRCNCGCDCAGDYYTYTDGFTCAQQAGWGKCTETFMQPPVCMHACGRCSANPSYPTVSPVSTILNPSPPTNIQPIAAVPTTSPFPPTSPTTASCGNGVSTVNRLIVHNGKRVFLSGINVAWGPISPNFGQDINYLSPGCTTTVCVNNRAFFTTLFATISSNGGNSVRFWLHPDGSALPVVNGDYSARIVDKPSSTHIASMQFLLNLGAQYNVLINFCLWSFDMVNDVGYGIQFGRWNKILTNSASLQSYLNNWLTPIVSIAAPYLNSSLLSFEVFNEPEGMTTKWGWTSCNSGTSDCAKVDIPTLQRFTNLVASTIHNVNRHIKVTVGSWSYQALSTVNGATNIWSDANLIAAGGAANGILDYYQIHYYNGFGSTWSPIQNKMTYWQTYDKPHVIGEIPNNPNPFTASSPQTGSYFYNTLLQNCYSGAWGWTYSGGNGNAEFDSAPFLKNMKYMDTRYGNLTRVNLASFKIPTAAPATYSPTPNVPCTDTYPYTDGYNCAQQAGWGQCSQTWMQSPVCDHSCGRC